MVYRKSERDGESERERELTLQCTRPAKQLLQGATNAGYFAVHFGRFRFTL